jgi:hypothetical protein
LLGQSASVAQRPPQQHLDVRVEAAELVSSPSREGIVDRWVDAQKDLLTLMAHV